jgi:uncharacterized membrane protein (UPF0136 family)
MCFLLCIIYLLAQYHYFPLFLEIAENKEVSFLYLFFFFLRLLRTKKFLNAGFIALPGLLVDAGSYYGFCYSSSPLKN